MFGLQPDFQSNERRKVTGNIYRAIWFNSLGWVVYRHCFDVGDDEIRTRIGAMEHKTAVFVTENEARDYCYYRNRLMDERGTDELPRAGVQ